MKTINKSTYKKKKLSQQLREDSKNTRTGSGSVLRSSYWLPVCQRITFKIMWLFYKALL